MQRKLGRLAAVFAFIVCAAPQAHSQAAQAAAELTERRQLSADVLSRHREQAGRIAAAFVPVQNGDDQSPFAVSIRELVGSGRLAASLRLDDAALEGALRTFDKAVTRVREIVASEKKGLEGRMQSANVSAAATTAASLAITEYTPMPTFPYSLSIKTVFSIGVGSRLDKLGVSSLDIGTNLIGTAFSAAVGAVGAPDALKDYLAKNLALGIGLPLRSGKSLSSGYSVGLGSVDISKVTVWPVIAFQQVDSGATNLPASVRLTDPSRAAWSVPVVGVGITLIHRSDVPGLLDKGQFVPIFTLGVRLPYYYPGNAANGFGALFTESINKFVGAEKPMYVIGLSVPLLRNDASR